MSSGATIHELPNATLQDCARVLRVIADQMDSGQYGKVAMAALVIESVEGEVRTFGMGGADHYRGLALFQLGIENLMRKHGDGAWK